MQSATVLLAGNLPAEPNSFIGRERDLAELAKLLIEVRALTLSGPGGIGKTRLAVRLARDVIGSAGSVDGTGVGSTVGEADLDEAWLVELADWRGQTAQRVAATIGVREEPGVPLAQTLAEALRSRHMLLVLDTCEHQVSDCATLVQLLLARCPWLRIVATSREPLRVRGETIWRVQPLDLPPDDAVGDELAGHEAIRLFAARAAGARPGFTLTEDNAAAVARLCRTLDGIPLGIELSAARVRALSVEQIADRLRDRFQLLDSGDRTAPPRQQTLRATVDWSYELLDEAEQMLLRRLAVFSGWNLDMAEQVCSDEAIPADAVLDLLISLIDKSLVVLDGEAAGDARYRLLDTIREYAVERLVAAGEESSCSCGTATASSPGRGHRPPDVPARRPALAGAPGDLPPRHRRIRQLPDRAGHFAEPRAHRSRGSAAVHGAAQHVGPARRSAGGGHLVRPVPGPGGRRGLAAGPRPGPRRPRRHRLRPAGLRHAAAQRPAGPGAQPGVRR
jgi:predicted ATPase